MLGIGSKTSTLTSIFGIFGIDGKNIEAEPKAYTSFETEPTFSEVAKKMVF